MCDRLGFLFIDYEDFKHLKRKKNKLEFDVNSEEETVGKISLLYNPHNNDLNCSTLLIRVIANNSSKICFLLGQKPTSLTWDSAPAEEADEMFSDGLKVAICLFNGMVYDPCRET